MAVSGLSILSERGVQELEQKPVLSRFRDSRLSRRGDGNHCLMIEVGVILVQLCREALGLFFLEELGPRPDSSGEVGFPVDSVRFHNTIKTFYSSGCAMRRKLIAMRW